MPPGEVHAQVARLNDRLKATLGYETDPISVNAAGSWRADGVAGVLRLNKNVELEVVPKFLDPASDDWRADFFLLAVLVRTGHLLVADEISAGVRDRGDLATLVARALLRMCSDNQRRPIRGYRRMTHTDFSLDGDVEWDTVLLPEPDGFRLQRLELSSRNAYNGLLKAAVDALIDEVGEGDTRVQLQRLSWRFGPQAKPGRLPQHLPQRHRSWQQAHDLARLVLEGRGLDLDGETFAGPGFILSTWAAWQSLCEELLRRALPGRRVRAQRGFLLGKRVERDVQVKPDISVLGAANDVKFLLDAKYKTRFERRTMIVSADVYESLAFLRAANTRRMMLLYPAITPVHNLPLGGWMTFDQVSVDDKSIEGIEIQVQGLATRGGFDKLVAGTRAALQPALDVGQG